MLKDFMDYCDMQLQSEMYTDDGCAPVTQPCVYNGLSKLPKNPVTTMAYVPFQTDTSMYEAEKALCHGTVFPDLDKPFLGGKCI